MTSEPPDDAEHPFEKPDIWTIEGVHGLVTVVRIGDVYILHTGRLTQQYLDPTTFELGLMSQTMPGHPSELDREQLTQLRDLIDRMLSE